jgi:hypothetical protein
MLTLNENAIEEIKSQIPEEIERYGEVYKLRFIDWSTYSHKNQIRVSYYRIVNMTYQWTNYEETHIVKMFYSYNDKLKVNIGKIDNPSKKP